MAVLPGDRDGVLAVDIDRDGIHHENLSHPDRGCPCVRHPVGRSAGGRQLAPTCRRTAYGNDAVVVPPAASGLVCLRDGPLVAWRASYGQRGRVSSVASRCDRRGSLLALKLQAAGGF